MIRTYVITLNSSYLRHLDRWEDIYCETIDPVEKVLCLYSRVGKSVNSRRHFDSDNFKMEKKNMMSKKSGKKEKKILEFEDILRLIGKWGRFQKYQLMMLGAVVIATAFHNLGMVMLGAVPSHRCAADPEDSGNVTSLAIIDVTNSSSDDESNQCNVVVYNETFGGYNSSGVVTPCSLASGKWHYDRNVFTRTIVSEWDLVCESKWMGAFSQMIYFIGYSVGCLVVSDLSDKYGRRLTLAISSAIQLVFGIAASFSPDFVTFTVLRFVVGIGTGGQRNAAFVLGQEWCTEGMRVIADIINGVMWEVGAVLLGLAAFGTRDWRHVQLAISAPMLIFVLFQWIVYPSPRWLLVKGRHKEAMEVLVSAAKWNGKELDPNLDLSAIELPKKQKSSLLDTVRTPNMRYTSFILWYHWYVMGLAFFGLSYNVGNMFGDFYVNFIVMSASGVLGMPVFYFLMKFGRRWPMVGLLMVCAVFNLIIMFTNKVLPMLTIVLATVGKIAIGVFAGIVYVYNSEVYPTSVRTIGLGVSSVFCRIGGMVAPYINDLSSIMATLPYIVYGASCLIGALLTLYVPETHKRRLMDNVEEAERYNRLYCRCREPTEPGEKPSDSDTSGEQSDQLLSKDV